MRCPGSKFDGAFYITRRGSDSWTTSALIPPQGPELSLLCATISPQAVGYSSDLSKAVLADGGNQPFCSADDPPLVSGEPSGAQNLFVAGGSSPLLVDPSPIAGGTPQQATFDGASSDLSTVVFDEQAQLTADAPGPPEVAPARCALRIDPEHYGEPDGEARDRPTRRDCSRRARWPAPALRAPRDLSGGAFGAVSADGSKIFFTATPTGSSTTNLYVRENPMSSSASTTQVDSGIGGGGVFLAATSDGSNVYFMDGAGNNLYEYNTTTNHLTDLTPGRERRASMALPGSTALAPVCTSSRTRCSHRTATRSVRPPPRWPAEPVSAAERRSHKDDVHRDAERGRQQRLESEQLDVPGFGQWLVHRVHNHERPEHQRPDEHASRTRSTCSTRARASSTAARAPRVARVRPPAPGSTPPVTPVDFANGEFLQRYVSNSGQLFFDTPDALLPAVQNNGVSDVYEWEADGTGSCSSSADNGGCLSLLSGGQSNQRVVLRGRQSRRKQRVLRHLQSAGAAGHRHGA